MINPLLLFCFSVFAQADSLPQVLPGTREGMAPVSQEVFSRELLDGAHRFVEAKIKQAGVVREQDWISAMASNNQSDQFNTIDQTDIEYFNGGHASRNKGVFDFLHQHLNWP